MKLQRRDILKAALAGTTLGVGGLINIDRGPLGPGLHHATNATSGGGRPMLDAYEILRHAVRTGTKLNLGGTSALAAGGDDTVLITIKVMNHIHSPLIFKFGQLAGNAVMPLTGAAAGFQPLSQGFNSATVLSTLMAKGLGNISQVPRWQNLRFNQWFGDMLDTGKIETGAAPAYLSAGDVAAFPAESDVAVQTFHGVSQTNLALNHAIQNCSLMKSTNPAGGDLANHVAMTKLINSPLGLVCFNMGFNVETDTANAVMQIYGNDLVAVQASGRPVVEYVSVIRQAIGLGLVDDPTADKINTIAGLGSPILDSIRASRNDLKNALSTLDVASGIEQAVAANAANTGNVMVLGTSSNVPATAQFLAQVKFVQQALNIPGRPLRNFTLFCHISDIDGGPLDTANRQSPPAEPISYVEGMRELAVGLNMLGQVIKAKKNVYVVVVSEGGRQADRGDDKSSCAIIMGPGGAGNLKDYMYGAMASINSSTDPFAGNPNTGNGNLTGVGQKIPDGAVMVTETGAPLSDHMTNGAILAGLAKQLEIKQSIATTTLAGLGKRVLLQTA